MNLLQICTRDVVTVMHGTTIIEAARVMRDRHVGTVIVMSNMLPPSPAGILTDRDIVIRAVAFAGEKTVLAVEQIMSHVLVLAPGSTELHEALQLMRAQGVRRLLVTGDKGKLEGIVSFDDIVMLFAEELTTMAKSIAAGLLREEKNANS
jgi:CBS domain-containing protein